MKKEYFELRIFICFIITLLYVNYTVMVSKNEEAKVVQVVQEKVLEGFEVRIVNDHTNERLELTETLGQALAYIEQYSMHHEDLVAFDLSTGSKVGSSDKGNGVIYTGF
tara:strand:- start:334 stop:660 length:327 start_codon:yes stop_codon:yes gene_type:complete